MSENWPGEGVGTHPGKEKSRSKHTVAAWKALECLQNFEESGRVIEGIRPQAGEVGESSTAKGSCPVLLTSHGTKVKCWSSDADRT